MAYAHRGGGFPFQQAEHNDEKQPSLEAQFDVLNWYRFFQSCARYFFDHAQYNYPVQALAAFMNIQLPFQKPDNPILSSQSAGLPPHIPGTGGPDSTTNAPPSSSRAASKLPMAHGPPREAAGPFPYLALLPYVRRLIATGHDFPAVLHGFFGDDWVMGIGPLHEQERRNYLFAAKSETWLGVRTAYDMGDGQTVPFLRPLRDVSEKEIVSAETNWSEWLAMQDWMLGPRAPGARERGGGTGAGRAGRGE